MCESVCVGSGCGWWCVCLGWVGKCVFVGCASGYVSLARMYRWCVHASRCVLAPMSLGVGEGMQGGWCVCFLVYGSMSVLMCPGGSLGRGSARACGQGVYLGALRGQGLGRGQGWEMLRAGCRGGQDQSGGRTGPCQPRSFSLAALSQAPRMPGSAALPLPWAPRRRPLWNVFGGRGPGWAQLHSQTGQQGGVPLCCLRGGGPTCLPPSPQLHALLSPRLGDSRSGHAVVS